MSEGNSRASILPAACKEDEEEEVFALHFAETLLGFETLARLIPSKSEAIHDHFSVYWRSASPVEPCDASNPIGLSREGDAASAAKCLYADILMHFQKNHLLENNNGVAVTVQFGSFWKHSSPSETRFLFTVLRPDPSEPSSHLWFARLRHDHFQALGIDVAATPGPVLASLWGRAWLNWTPDQSTFDTDDRPCWHLQYPPEFARSRVPFPSYHAASTKPRVECEIVPALMAQSILLQHRQQTSLLSTSTDATTAVSTAVTSDYPMPTKSCWDLYRLWKQQTPLRSVSSFPSEVTAEMVITGVSEKESEPISDVPSAPAVDAADGTTTAISTEATAAPPSGPNAKRRRIVRPNAPRRAPVSSTRPPGNRFV